MKKTLATWKWSLAVVARSPRLVLALAAVAALWGLGAYKWLWLPESSGLLLLVALVWGLAQVLVLVGVLTGAATSAGEAAAASATHLGLRSFVGFNRRQFARCLVMVTASGLLALALAALFGRCNEYTLEVASFLTFHSEKPVSPVTVAKVFWVIQTFLWIVIWGFLLSFLIVLLRTGWREAKRQSAHLIANCCWRSSFLTSLLSVVVFGGLAYLLASWHPKVSAGFWDYAQLLLRMGGALLLLVFGWLFWMLSLARLSLPTAEGPSS
jgi:magnesium-transporting ATPase (P-type)